MDQPPKRSLADDPNFLASLAELERGLNDLNEATQEPVQPAIPKPAPAPAPPPPQRTSTVPPPTAPPTTRATMTVGPRPLLDLFPPESLVTATPPAAPAPQRPQSPPTPRAAGPTSTARRGESFRAASHVDASSPTVDRGRIDFDEFEEDAAVPEPQRTWTERVLMAVLFLVLMLVGAAAAAWVFHASFTNALSRWQRHPAPASEPARPLPAPATPAPAPATPAPSQP